MVKFNYSIAVLTIIGFTLYGTVKEMKSLDQLELMVYDIYDGTVIDIIDGKTLYTYSSIPRQDNSEQFMCENYRLSKSINEREQITSQNYHKGNNLLINNGFILTKDKTLLIAHDNINHTSTRPIDYLVLTASYKGNVSQLISKTKPRNVIIDKSMSWDQYYDFKHYLSAIDQPTLNIFNTGALKLKL